MGRLTLTLRWLSVLKSISRFSFEQRADLGMLRLYGGVCIFMVSSWGSGSVWICISTRVFMLVSGRVCTDSASVNTCAWVTSDGGI